MTYGQLLEAATTWTARHIAKDLKDANGKDEVASAKDILTISDWQVKEGGESIAPSTINLNEYNAKMTVTVLGF